MGSAHDCGLASNIRLCNIVRGVVGSTEARMLSMAAKNPQFILVICALCPRRACCARAERALCTSTLSEMATTIQKALRKNSDHLEASRKQ